MVAAMSSCSVMATTHPPSTSEMHPADLGIELASLTDLQVDGVEASAGVIRSVLLGKPGPAADIACLNAAAALVVADVAADLKDGLAKARKACADGDAMGVLVALVRVTNG